MPIDDSPEIIYHELDLPATELFSPEDNPAEYLQACLEDLVENKFAHYGYNQLVSVKEAFSAAYHALLNKEVKNLENEEKLSDDYSEGEQELVRIISRKIIEEVIEKTEEDLQRLYKDRDDDYTLEDFFKNPVKGISFRSIYSEMQQDLDFSYLFSGKRKLLKTNLAAFASFGIFSLPHELIHAGVNHLAGGINKEIVLNTLYGGFWWERLIPGVESKLLFPLLGGYVRFENPSTAGTIAAAAAPYILTPLGIYLMKKGKEKESIVLCAGGAGLGLAHLGGIIGDWRLVGQSIIKETAGLAGETLDIKFPKDNVYASTAATLGMVIGGVYIGSKLLAISYRGSKAVVNSMQNLVNKENFAK